MTHNRSFHSNSPECAEESLVQQRTLFTCLAPRDPARGNLCSVFILAQKNPALEAHDWSLQTAVCAAIRKMTSPFFCWTLKFCLCCSAIFLFWVHLHLAEIRSHSTPNAFGIHLHLHHHVLYPVTDCMLVPVMAWNKTTTTTTTPTAHVCYTYWSLLWGTFTHCFAKSVYHGWE